MIFCFASTSIIIRGPELACCLEASLRVNRLFVSSTTSGFLGCRSFRCEILSQSTWHQNSRTRTARSCSVFQGNGSVGRIPQLPTVSRRYGISVLIITDIALAAFISALIVGVSLHYHKIVQNEYWGYPEVPNNFHATAQSFN